MLLQSLRRFTHAGFTPTPRLYNTANVRYIVELTDKGQAVGWYDKRDEKTKTVLRRPMPQLDSRSSNIVALPFFGHSEYTFGLARPTTTDIVRVQKCHRAYIDLVEECLRESNEPFIQSVYIFLQSAPIEQLTSLKGDEFTQFDRSANITFMVDGEFVVDLPAVQEFWANKNDTAAEQRRVMQCIVCKNVGPVLETMELTIKGLPGGNSKGVPFFSANSPVFESYGLEKSYIAPVCTTCAERFTKVMNFLLERPDSHFNFGNMKFAFWTKGRDVSATMKQLQNPTERRSWREGSHKRAAPVTAGMAKSIVEAPYYAQGTPNIDGDRFYAIALAANPGRAIVRDWIDTTLADVEHNVDQWFRRHRIITHEKGEIEEFGIKDLATATVRAKAKDIKARTPSIAVTYGLLRTAILGQRLPNGLLYQVIRLCYSERSVTDARAALIKLALLSQSMPFVDTLDKEGRMEKLEPEFEVDQDPRITAAYHCGRAFAVLERIQVLDMGRLTTLERLFGAALTKPGLTFPSLVGAAQRVHLPRIQNRGTAHALRTELDHTLGKVPASIGIPAVLKLQEQGWFILGYHHQRLHNEAKRNDSIARNQRQNTTQQAELFSDTDDAEIE